MDVPLIVDEQDPKWKLLGQILKIFVSRRVKQPRARQGLTPVPKAALMLRAVLVAMFFSLELAYVLDELELKQVKSPHEPIKVYNLDPFDEKRCCPKCGAPMIRKQINHTIEVGDILQQSYGTPIPLPTHHAYWECPNCSPDLPPLHPGPPSDFF
ncbi:MAG: hypothetical protein ACE5R6_06040 [Candidatus Heimdallarchaeota archaeon]